jgi:protoheme IX farnesyltransferase
MSSSVPFSGVLSYSSEYLKLCKPRVVSLIVFTAIIGMFLATPEWVRLSTLLAGTFGIGLAACSAAALNHVVESRTDALMERTRNRPLPQGGLTRGQALVFAIVLGTISMIVLDVLVNRITAILTFASLIGYAVVYTMYLKHATPQNIVIGGAAGAAPPVLGWTAVTGSVDPHALLLFLIIFVWTPPHFWALAIYRRDDYAKALIPMLPVTHGVTYTRMQILYYSVMLVIATLLPYITYMSGVPYLLGAVCLNVVLLFYVIKMQFDHSDELAMTIFRYSIVYLTLLFGFFFIDHYWSDLVFVISNVN